MAARMIELTITDIAAVMSGRIVGSPDAAATVSGTVHTDSRLVRAGDIFFALPGDVTDGHLFAPDAVAAGAALLIVEHALELDVPQIEVADGVAALAALATEVVARVRVGGALTVIAVTGSNGKTTTKNMLRAICSAEGETIAPEGSFNNHVGAPISMLGVTRTSRFLLVEAGASGPGEIARIAAMAPPDIAIELKVGLAHAGEFGGIDSTFVA
jgi:UDP-N-acetylmuramoyl-tripeptide--D-alanyl-D-alanine ligase